MRRKNFIESTKNCSKPGCVIAKEDDPGMSTGLEHPHVREIKIAGHKCSIRCDCCRPDDVIGTPGESFQNDCVSVVPVLLEHLGKIVWQILVDLELHTASLNGGGGVGMSSAADAAANATAARK
jgi:hypothetical protein